MNLESDAALRQTVLEFLDKHHKMVLTVLDKDGAPSSSLMHYVIADDFSVFIGTKKGFGKYEAMTHDERVSLAVVEEGEDPLRVVDMQGRAAPVPPDMVEETYKFFKDKNMTKHYVQGAEDFVMFKIVPFSVRWMDASSGELKITDLIGRQ